jgi:hypothetical protein
MTKTVIYKVLQSVVTPVVDVRKVSAAFQPLDA